MKNAAKIMKIVDAYDDVNEDIVLDISEKLSIPIDEVLEVISWVELNLNKYNAE